MNPQKTQPILEKPQKPNFAPIFKTFLIIFFIGDFSKIGAKFGFSGFSFFHV